MHTYQFQADASRLAMLHALMRHEDQETESDMLRVLIRRAYRALPENVRGTLQGDATPTDADRERADI
jgi:hypothetical protein